MVTSAGNLINDRLPQDIPGIVWLSQPDPRLHNFTMIAQLSKKKYLQDMTGLSLEMSTLELISVSVRMEACATLCSRPVVRGEDSVCVPPGSLVPGAVSWPRDVTSLRVTMVDSAPTPGTRVWYVSVGTLGTVEHTATWRTTAAPVRHATMEPRV